jgi:hypothetical protein
MISLPNMYIFFRSILTIEQMEGILKHVPELPFIGEKYTFPAEFILIKKLFS